ncbi:Kinase [Hexamita inflata]|uniref:Kinase n=1 Tax=Hexamita inflata TaxID=28002 RepID=A0AA86Q1J9_9EUKA|nr:Kinase [Hexamita inflata]
MQQPILLHPGDILEQRFQIIKEIGQGSQAIIFLAKDIKNQQKFAIKQYNFVDALDPADVQQIENEVQMLQSINHINVVRCFQILRYPKQYILIMEYIDGCSLASFIKQQFPNVLQLEEFISFKQLYQEIKPFENGSDIRYTYHSIIRKMLKDKIRQQQNLNEQLLCQGFTLDKNQTNNITYEQLIDKATLSVSKNPDIFTAQETPRPVQKNINVKVTYNETVEYLFSQLLEVLVLLQSKGIMHRDLKPDNIMLTKSMQLKLIDFGFCKRASVTSTMVGTPGFLAPEISMVKQQDRKYNHKIDIWSAGCIFYQMLFGYVPFLVNRYILFESLQASKGLYLPTDLFGENYADRKFIDLIERAFIADPEKRPDARELQALFFESASQIQTTIELESELVHTVKVFFTGDFGVGKSTLLKKMSKSQLEQQLKKVSRTIILNKKKIQLDFYDTLGTEQRNCSLIPSLTRDTNLCFLVCNLQVERTFESLGTWRQFVENSSRHCRFVELGVDFGGEKVVQNVTEIQLNTDLDKILFEEVQKCIDEKCFLIEEIKKPTEQKKKGCC